MEFTRKQKQINISIIHVYTHQVELATFLSNCIRFININKRFRGRYTQTQANTYGTRTPHGKDKIQIKKNLSNYPFSQCIAPNKTFKIFIDIS